MKISINELKAKTGVGFGTSGVRDLATNLTNEVVYAYTTAFINHLKRIGDLKKSVALAGDLRESTDRIMTAVCRACKDNQLEVINCGKIPTPAVSYFGIVNSIPSIMVTGSHIPGDRNGIKFNLSNREILKRDEEMITNSEIEIEESLIEQPINLPQVDDRARQIYIERYLTFFPEKFLNGKKIGLYGHSAVGRDIFGEILEKLGAEVVKIDYSEIFVPIDTDTVDEELVKKLKIWKNQYKINYIISTDGDGDRPLLSDEDGEYIRADLMPVIAAKYLGIEAVATSITANTMVEKTGYFKKIVRTKVGSPYIAEAMMALRDEGYKKIAGYELNGGFLLETDLDKLVRLPTRDAVLVILSVLANSISAKIPIKDLLASLPQRSTYSLSIKGIPTEKSLAILEGWKNYRDDIVGTFGTIKEVNLVDGLRLTFENGEIVHFRPSKNAPEFRNYTEAETADRAKLLSEKAIGLIERWADN